MPYFASTSLTWPCAHQVDELQHKTDRHGSQEPATTACAAAEEPAVAGVEEASSGMFSLHRARSNVDELYDQDGT